MRRFLVRAGLAALLLAPVAAFLHYNLPGYDVVRITQTEVRRVDRGAANPVGDGTRDVYYIFAEDPDTGAPRVYQNEDTGWGWPPYFKFDSANVQARAAAIAADRGTALVVHYGWRVPMVSWFPNALSVRRVEPGYAPIPWFNIVFFVVLAGLVAWAWIMVARFRRRRADAA